MIKTVSSLDLLAHLQQNPLVPPSGQCWKKTHYTFKTQSVLHHHYSKLTFWPVILDAHVSSNSLMFYSKSNQVDIYVISSKFERKFACSTLQRLFAIKQWHGGQNEHISVPFILFSSEKLKHSEHRTDHKLKYSKTWNPKCQRYAEKGVMGGFLLW